MTDEEYRQQVRKRWQESMALLGIEDSGSEPEPERTAPTAQADIPPMPPEREPESISAQSEWSPQPERPHVEAHPLDPEPAHGHEREPEPAEAEWREPDLSVTSEPTESVAEEMQPAAEESAAEDPDRRRRGRRGRRGQKPETATAKDKGRGKGEVEAHEKEEGGRRGRGRPRQRTSKPPLAEAVEKDEPETIEAAVDSDFGDDEPTDLSEWNVPSWQDLIASLYRPER